MGEAIAATRKRTQSTAVQIHQWVQAALQNGLPLAVWRHPNEQVKHCLVSWNPIPQQINPDLEELPSGFLARPFDQEAKAYFLPADFYWNSQLSEIPHEDSPNLPETGRQFFQDQQENKTLTEQLPWHENPTAMAEPEDKAAYERLVTHSIEEIKAGTFQKVVPSRRKKVPLPKGYPMLDAFHKMCEKYPNAFISLISIPTVGTWMGATPEVLLKVENQQIFRTVALAGTQHWAPEQDIANAAWRQKEIEEQAMVSRYIINCFKKIRLREFEERGPRSSRAGSMIHLKTDFTVDMEATRFPNLGTVMLDLLHPTSAVCGMPKGVAASFLAQHEGYSRELYAGYLGPVNLNNHTSLYVNLRCMQRYQGTAILYAGAGVTADSQPIKEWEETELKCNTLLSVLQESATTRLK